MKRVFRADAFTLLEVIMAMGLFAIGLMGAFLMSSGLMHSNQNARHRSAALHLARNSLETLRHGEYADVSDNVETDLDADGNASMGIFRREVLVEEKGGPARKEVTVTVSWRSGGEHRVVLKTIFSP